MYCVDFTGKEKPIHGKRGISKLRHIIDGYDYCTSKSWDEVARICLTHSFPVRDFEKEISNKDMRKEQCEFVANYLQNIEYDDYDKLIILCDSFAMPDCCCILEKRFIDTARRYGVYPFSVERWNKTYEYKEYFESKIGKSIYTLLPDIEKCIYI